MFRWTSSGVFVWAKQFTGGDTQARSIALDSAGSVYTAGIFPRKVYFNPGPKVLNLTDAQDGDAFVVKLDTNGAWVWSKQLGGGSSSVAANGIAVDSAGNAYTTAYVTGGAADFNPGSGVSELTPPTTQYIALVVQFGHKGDFVWAKQINTRAPGGNSIALDDSSNVYITGQFVRMAYFDPDVRGQIFLNSASAQIHITKFSSAGVYDWARNVGAPPE